MGLQIWIAFIGWATFYHCGGKEAGLSKSITHLVFGAIMALIALLLVTKIPLGAALGVPLWAGICVLITVGLMVYAAKSPMLSDIPASVYGYAAVAGLALAGGKLGAVTEISLGNPFINATISLDHRRGARLHLREGRGRVGEEVDERSPAALIFGGGANGFAGAPSGPRAGRTSARIAVASRVRGAIVARRSASLRSSIWPAKTFARSSSSRRSTGEPGAQARARIPAGFEASVSCIALRVRGAIVARRRAPPEQGAAGAVGRGHGERHSHSTGRDGGRSRSRHRRAGRRGRAGAPAGRTSSCSMATSGRSGRFSRPTRDWPPGRASFIPMSRSR